MSDPWSRRTRCRPGTGTARCTPRLSDRDRTDLRTRHRRTASPRRRAGRCRLPRRKRPANPGMCRKSRRTHHHRIPSPRSSEGSKSPRSRCPGRHTDSPRGTRCSPPAGPHRRYRPRTRAGRRRALPRRRSARRTPRRSPDTHRRRSPSRRRWAGRRTHPRCTRPVPTDTSRIQRHIRLARTPSPDTRAGTRMLLPCTRPETRGNCLAKVESRA